MSRAAMGAGAALLLALSACHGADEQEAPEPGSSVGQTVTAAPAEVRSLARVVTVSGTVSAWEEVPVGAETGGLTVVALLVDEGSWVRRGQPLLRLNDTLLRAQLAQQEAGLAAAQANAEREDGDLARAQELRERGFLSQASLDMALSEQRAAAAQRASAEAAVAETRARLDQTVIRAPVAGLVVSRSVTLGQIIQPGAELFRLVRDGRLELDAQVPETELGLVRAGQSAEISSEGVGSATGRVRIVTPEVNPQTRLGVARISLSANEGLRPGMFARARIDVGAQDTVVAPSQAVLYRENRAGVFVLGDANRVRFHPVTVLNRTEDTTAVDGLDAGVQVVVVGAGFLSDGDRVRIAPSEPASGGE